MVVFFIAVVVMVLSALVLVVSPLLRDRVQKIDSRDQQNKTIAIERIRELEEQHENALINDDELAQAKLEVERTLLDEIRDEGAVVENMSHSGQRTAIVVSVLLPVLAGIMYLLLGQPDAVQIDRMAARQSPATQQSQGQNQVSDINQMIEGLKRKLQENPGDIEGWYLLGNSYMRLQQFATAAEVFQKLRQIVGDQPELLIRLADALAMANGNRLAGEPEALIQRTLQQQPDHPTALWLAGVAAQQRGQPRAALKYWERAKSQLGDNPEASAELDGMIAQVKQRSGSAQQATTQNVEPDTTITSAASIKVHVTLDPLLVDKVSPGDTLFILARAIDGPPMPLAVTRKQAKELPLEVTLDDSMAMMPAIKLSQFDRVRVVAKVSKTGNAKTQPGDLIGESQPITPGEDLEVTVRIEKMAK